MHGCRQFLTLYNCSAAAMACQNLACSLAIMKWWTTLVKPDNQTNLAIIAVFAVIILTNHALNLGVGNSGLPQVALYSSFQAQCSRCVMSMGGDQPPGMSLSMYHTSSTCSTGHWGNASPIRPGQCSRLSSSLPRNLLAQCSTQLLGGLIPYICTWNL